MTAAPPRTFTGVVTGLLTAGITVCAQIATHSPLLAVSPAGEERVRRFVQGSSTALPISTRRTSWRGSATKP
jgi:hypothetical protein